MSYHMLHILTYFSVIEINWYIVTIDRVTHMVYVYILWLRFKTHILGLWILHLNIFREGILETQRFFKVKDCILDICLFLNESTYIFLFKFWHILFYIVSKYIDLQYLWSYVYGNIYSLVIIHFKNIRENALR